MKKMDIGLAFNIFPELNSKGKGNTILLVSVASKSKCLDIILDI